MKHVTVKMLLCEAAIGAAICAGGYFMLVEPMERDIARAREEITTTQTRSQLGTTSALPTADAQRLVDSAAGLRNEVARRSDTARTEAGMFAALVGLAETHGLRVDEVQPVTPGAAKSVPTPMPIPPPTATATGASPPPAPVEPVLHRGYSISAGGTYSGIASFIRALQNDLGLTAVKSVRMTPDATPGSSKVHCAIETEHWSLLRPSLHNAGATNMPGNSPVKELSR